MLRTKGVFLSLGLLGALISLTLALPAQNQPRTSGFLDDYPPLKKIEGTGAYFWEDPNLSTAYDRLVIEQPEVFFHPDSKHKGMKPDQLKALADAFAEDLATKLIDRGVPVVFQAGPSTAVLRVAIANVYMTKSKFRPWNIMPAGLAMYSIKAAVGKNVSLIQATLEAEVLDSLTGKRIAVVVDQRGQHKNKEEGLKKQKTSWDQVLDAIQSMTDLAVERMAYLKTQHNR